MVGTRSLSSGAHSRDPVALPTLRTERGRPGIPETFVHNRKASGILGAPLEAGHDSGGGAESHSRGANASEFFKQATLIG